MIKKYIKRTLLQGQKLLAFYPLWISKCEFEKQKFIRINERPVEISFVFKHLSIIYPRSVLDVGTGTTSLPNMIRNCGCLVTAIDNIKGYWPLGLINWHYYIINDDITNSKLSNKFDLITCVSVLEHIPNFNDAVKNMFKLLNPKGYLILTFPYNENAYIQNVYNLSGSSYGQGFPFITQSFSRIELNGWLEENQAMLIEQEYWQFWDGDYWTIGNQIIPPKKATAECKHQLSCIVIRRKD